MTVFIDFQAQWTPQINQYLKKHLTTEVDTPKISQIMAYSVLAGGKRLRPLLFLATLMTLKIHITPKLLRVACGIELIHTYSLIHDDLPAMDNADLRRGHLSSHKKWGEAEAILAGDGLLPLGIAWIADGSQNVDLVQIITAAIGPNGMVGGQYRDIDSTNNQNVAHNADFINKMEWLKTGCLLLASVKMAMVVAKTTNEKKKYLLDFAKAFGRAYQIYDDLVDVVESSAQAGKTTHADQAEGKNNTLTLLGIKRSRQELKNLIKRAHLDLDSLNGELLEGFLNLYQKVL